MTDGKTLNPSLDLSKDEMRALGYRAVDLLVEHFDTIPDRSPVATASRSEMDQLLMEPIPENGMETSEVLAEVTKDVFPNCDLLTHPRFFSFVPSPNNYVSALADFLASGFNVFAGGWVTSPAAVEVELVTINWLLNLFGLPEKEGGGLYTSGGSVANLTGLAAARRIKLRERLDGATLYLSDQAHSSNIRAAKLLGFQPDQIRIVPSDAKFRMDVDALQTLFQADVAGGKEPFCVLATAGTTNTGAVDPLEEIAAFCRVEDLWMHVDAAYGGAAILTDEGRSALKGIERAHSITVDPHKWMFQPYEIGCLLVREHAWLKATFAQAPEYLRDIQGSSEEVNLYDHGVQLTRGFRALKFYMSIKTFGLASFREAVQIGCDTAKETETFLRQRPDWEIVSPATLGVLAFRYKPAESNLSGEEVDALNEHLSKEIVASGHAMLVTTVLKGMVVLRMCLINPRIEFDRDVRSTILALEEIAAEYGATLES